MHTLQGQRYYVALAPQTASRVPPEPNVGRITHMPPPLEGMEEPHPEHWRLLWQTELECHRQRKAQGLPVPVSPPPEPPDEAVPPLPPPPLAAPAAVPTAVPGTGPPPTSKPRAPSFHPSLMMVFKPEESNSAEETVVNRRPPRRR